MDDTILTLKSELSYNGCAICWNLISNNRQLDLGTQSPAFSKRDIIKILGCPRNLSLKLDV